MHDPLQRLYRTKLALLATLLFFVGLGLLIFSHWIQHQTGWHWLGNWPIADIGSGLFTTGLLGVALQYFDGQDSEVRATHRLERVLAAATPAMRDAVIDGFAFEPDDLARVATPETLDRIVTNAMTIRLGDAQFADELYRDVREQAMGVPERLYDARISIRLAKEQHRVAGRAPMFETTIRWESTLVPVFPTRRFVCVSDLAELRDLDQEKGATSAWYVKPRPGVDAGDRSVFELVDFTVDGKPRAIRRASKPGGQTYSVGLGREVMAVGRPVRIAYTYRTLTAVDGNLLQFRFDQPTRGLAIELEYTHTHLSDVDVLDYTGRSRALQISNSLHKDTKTVSITLKGWVLRRSGLAFAWGKQPAENL